MTRFGGKWILFINFIWILQARLARVSVIIVGTFLDRIKTGNTEILLQQFHQDINTLYNDGQENCGKYPKEDHFGIYPHLSMVKFVSLVTRSSFKQEASMLRDIVYYAALNFSKITGRVKEFFIGQPVRTVQILLRIISVFVWLQSAVGLYS